MAATIIEAHCLNIDLADRAADVALATSDERGRAEQFRSHADGRRFLARRAATRRLLAARLRVAPGDVVIAFGPFGRPYLPASTLHFSVSHAGPLALIAIGDRILLGCDIEQTVPHGDLLDIAENCFTVAEAARVAVLEGNERIVNFYDCWTRKEAYLKAVGVGMSLPMNSFEFVSDASGTARLTDGGADWSSVSWTPSPGYRAAIVAAGDRWVLDRIETHVLDQR